ncbi:hypothetical protein ABT297_29905 [Dactylosporangium sp. NPDC000555]|uniref:hypothetical protein n=1 Tax=Dactylosporangium sp. NPDC000555 TaxID=3154260 RepID=UPI00333485FD
MARLLATENGKPVQQARGEVEAVVRIFRGYAGEATPSVTLALREVHKDFWQQVPKGLIIVAVILVQRTNRPRSAKGRA